MHIRIGNKPTIHTASFRLSFSNIINETIGFILLVYFSIDIARGLLYSSDSQPGFRGTLGYREHFLGVPRDVEITNVL